MKTSRIISFFLVLAVVAGQVQYSYTYCAMMKRSVDPSMERRCFSHLAPASRDGQRLISPLHTMLHMVSKGTTDAYEQPKHSDANYFSGTLSHVIGEEVEPIAFIATNHSDNEHPPPDIVIQNLNLRI